MSELNCERLSLFKTPADFAAVFPEAREVYTAGQLVDARRRGVFYVNEGSLVAVKINGVCPNLTPKGCRLGGKCSTTENR